MDSDSPYMMPTLTPYGKAVWRDTLKMLDGEQLSAVDYVLLENFCQVASQLRDLNDRVSKQPTYTIVEGIVKKTKGNELAWQAQSLSKTVMMLSDKLGLNRVARREGNDSTPVELLEFLRSEKDGDED